MRTPAVPLTAAALALIAAGCGTPGPAGSARGTVDAFLLNCDRGDGPSAMEVLVEPAQDVFDEAAGAEAGCRRILGARPGGAHVQGVRVDGEVATADVATTEGARRLALSFGPEGWRIEGPH